jgi:hypothetical protein
MFAENKSMQKTLGLEVGLRFPAVRISHENYDDH